MKKLMRDNIIKALEICGTVLDTEVLKTVLDAGNRVSPWIIEELDEDEVFVFGSDERGIHDGRASLMAVDEFGAQQGICEGMSGNSYAIPTTKVNKKVNQAEAEKYLEKLKCAMTKEEREQVPQLLLQYVKERGYEENKKKKKGEREIYGVMYTSVQIPVHEQTNGQEIYGNVVLPVIDIKDSYCSRLKDMFEWTEPYCLEFSSSSDRTITNGGGSRFVEIENQINQLKV